MSKRPVLLGAFSALLSGACATLPSGPSVMVLPGAQKTFEQFRADDALCQFYARQAVGGKLPHKRRWTAAPRVPPPARPSVPRPER